MPHGALALLLAAALALPGGLAAQASPRLQPLDPVHRDLGRLAAWGMIDTILVGQRPFSRAQAARMTAQALRARATLTAESPLAPSADRALARLQARLAPELAELGVGEDVGGLPLVGEARVDATWTDSPPRDVPSNVVATSMARINPLLAYDQGRRVGDGTTVGVELDVGGALGSRIAASVSARVQHTLPLEGESETSLTIQTGNARALLGGVALTVGHDHVIWGQAPQGGLVLSANPRALLLASLATEFPLSLPLLGPTHLQAFLADLGTESQRFAHSQLFGWRVSSLPSPRLELGAEFLVQSGGEGAPEMSFKDRILDYMFFPDLFYTSDFLFSNKVAGVDARLRVPEARGLELWVEMVIDDIDIDRFRSMMWEDGSWSVGARLQRLNDAGTLAVRIEGQHTGLRMYEHGDFTSGLTLERRLLGSELGPDGNSVALGIDWEAGQVDLLSLEGVVERRSNDHYQMMIGTPYWFARLAVKPKETRWRARVAWERQPTSARWSVRLEGGYEYVDNLEFTELGTLHNLLVRTVIVARLP